MEEVCLRMCLSIRVILVSFIQVRFPPSPGPGPTPIGSLRAGGHEGKGEGCNTGCRLLGR